MNSPEVIDRGKVQLTILFFEYKSSCKFNVIPTNLDKAKK